MRRWLGAKLRTLRLRLFGPGDILGYDPNGEVEPDVGRVIQLAACQHRYWGPCTWRVYGGTWGWFTTCRVCGRTARC